MTGVQEDSFNNLLVYPINSEALMIQFKTIFYSLFLSNVCCCCVASVVSDSVRPQRRQPIRLPHPWDSPGKNTGVGCHFLLQCMKVKSESEVAQSCPTLSDPMDCSPPGSSIHGIFQARVLEWGAIAFSVNPWQIRKIIASVKVNYIFILFSYGFYTHLNQLSWWLRW